jgi:low temperature requirement protein LtrA
VAQREQRVTPLELFFDLVFVFALTQVTLLMSDDPTWSGLGRGMLVLALLWWAWIGYAWLTNLLEPEASLVRAGMFVSMGAMLVVALAVPDAFGEHGVLFGVAYLAVRLLQLLLYLVAAKGDPDMVAALRRLLPSAAFAPVLVLLAAGFDGPAQVTLWLAAIAVDYLGVLVGRGEGYNVSAGHLAERYGLIVIIALGESIVAIGVGAAGEPLTASVVAASVLGIAVVATLWWAYFDIFAVLAQQQLAVSSGADRVRLARDYYSYLHLPMIAGIVLFALGLKLTIEDVGDPLPTVPAVALCGGLSLYFLSHVALRIRLVREVRRTSDARPAWIGPGRLVAGIGMLAVLPVALELPALTALAAVTGLCCALILYDVIHYREHRAEVRQARFD